MSLQFLNKLSYTQRAFIVKSLPTFEDVGLFETTYTSRDLNPDVLRNFSRDVKKLHGSVSRALINKGIVRDFHNQYWLTDETAEAWGYPTYAEVDSYFVRLREQITSREALASQRNKELPTGQVCAYTLQHIGFSDFKTCKLEYENNYVTVLAIIPNNEDVNNVDVEFANLRMLALVLVKHDEQNWEIVPIEITANKSIVEVADDINFRGIIKTLNAGRKYDNIRVLGFSNRSHYRNSQVCAYELSITHVSSTHKTHICSMSSADLTPKEAFDISEVLRELVGISASVTERVWDMIEQYTMLRVAY